MHLYDIIALGVFVICWLGYEPLIKRIRTRGGAINADMAVIRMGWMRAMTHREMRLIDSQLMGHAINSASFFASANLILIAAVAGAMFSTDVRLPSAEELGIDIGKDPLIEIKFGLMLVCLSRGFLDFTWSIRQMNYALAIIGAYPEDADPPRAAAYADAASEVLNPALTAFSQGVRGYYFSLAAAAWLFGPWAFAAAAVGAFTLLAWRQSRSRAARGLSKIRSQLEEHPSPTGAAAQQKGEHGTGVILG
jgi:uncharacterized membrane protein